jgi:hypothetical protein
MEISPVVNEQIACDAAHVADSRSWGTIDGLGFAAPVNEARVHPRKKIAGPNATVGSRPYPAADLVPAARRPREKRREFNCRRKADPLGEGQACTWRTQLIKSRRGSSQRRAAFKC